MMYLLSDNNDNTVDGINPKLSVILERGVYDGGNKPFAFTLNSKF